MELFCGESDRDVVKSEVDSSIIGDDRVLERLLKSEDRYAVTCNYFRHVQNDITPCMRKICTSWMMEVCEEEKCEPCVFPLAVNFMDRFLSKVTIRKQQLQLLGCSCLLMSSKIRQCDPIDTKKLTHYTDYSCDQIDILNWELLVLGRLQWDVAAVIPMDFLDTLVSRLPIEKVKSMVWKHSRVFSELCALDFKFCSWPASIVALGCVGAAVKGIPRIKVLWPDVDHLALFFEEVTGIEADTIQYHISSIEQQVASHVLQFLELEVHEKNSIAENETKVPTSGSAMIANTKDCSDQLPETPTDVQNVVI